MLKFTPFLCTEVNYDGCKYSELGTFPTLEMAFALLVAKDPKVKGSLWEFSESLKETSGQTCLDFYQTASFIQIAYEYKHPVRELVDSFLTSCEVANA